MALVRLPECAPSRAPSRHPASLEYSITEVSFELQDLSWLSADGSQHSLHQLENEVMIDPWSSMDSSNSPMTDSGPSASDDCPPSTSSEPPEKEPPATSPPPRLPEASDAKTEHDIQSKPAEHKARSRDLRLQLDPELEPRPRRPHFLDEDYNVPSKSNIECRIPKPHFLDSPSPDEVDERSDITNPNFLDDEIDADDFTQKKSGTLPKKPLKMSSSYLEQEDRPYRTDFRNTLQYRLDNNNARSSEREKRASALYAGSWGSDAGRDPWLHNDASSVRSFSSNGSVDGMRPSSNLENKMECVCSLISLLTLSPDNNADLSGPLLEMSRSVESCIAMRQAGCIPLLVQLIHSKVPRETRDRAAKALRNIIHTHTDDRAGKREARVWRLLEQVREYCYVLENVVEARKDGKDAVEDDSSKHPSQSVAALMKLSFDEEHRHVVCRLGGLQALAALVAGDHAAHGPRADDQTCLTMRKYAGMTLTNLTFGDGNNKSLLCSFRDFMLALVEQLESPNDDMRQVTAAVLRNLSWRADAASKTALRETGAVRGLTRAAMTCRKEATLKSVLSALWNLTAHCSMNKVALCSVPGALGFLVDMLSYASPSKTLAVVENAGGIMRNVSSHIAVREDYRQVLRERHCLAVLLQHLKSPSLTVVSNACGTLWNLSARCPRDQQFLWERGAAPMLRSLIHSKHKMIATGAGAALKNLLNSAPGRAQLAALDAARAARSPTMPTLPARKPRPLDELDPGLAETCDNIEPPASPAPRSDDKALFAVSERHLALSLERHMSSSSPLAGALVGRAPLAGFLSCSGSLARVPPREDARASVSGAQSDGALARRRPKLPVPTPRARPAPPVPPPRAAADADAPVDYGRRFAETKPAPPADYQETDLDQPTDYSLRYAEGGGAGAEPDCLVHFATEGTPGAGTPGAATPGAGTRPDSPERPARYCTEDTPAQFSRRSSLSSLAPTTGQHTPCLPTKDNQGSKSVTFASPVPSPPASRDPGGGGGDGEAGKSVADTPLMFSRSSSLGSLPDAPPTDTHTPLSEFSRLTSGCISPSDIPDSPGACEPRHSEDGGAGAYSSAPSAASSPPASLTPALLQPQEHIHVTSQPPAPARPARAAPLTHGDIDRLPERNSIAVIREPMKTGDSCRVYCTEDTPARSTAASRQSPLSPLSPADPTDPADPAAPADLLQHAIQQGLRQVVKVQSASPGSPGPFSRDNVYRSLPAALRADAAPGAGLAARDRRDAHSLSPPPLPPRAAPPPPPPPPAPLALHGAARSGSGSGGSLSSLSLDSFGSTDRELFEETVQAGLRRPRPASCAPRAPRARPARPRSASPADLSDSPGDAERELFARAVRAGLPAPRHALQRLAPPDRALLRGVIARGEPQPPSTPSQPPPKNPLAPSAGRAPVDGPPGPGAAASLPDLLAPPPGPRAPPDLTLPGDAIAREAARLAALLAPPVPPALLDQDPPSLFHELADSLLEPDLPIGPLTRLEADSALEIAPITHVFVDGDSLVDLPALKAPAPPAAAAPDSGSESILQLETLSCLALQPDPARSYILDAAPPADFDLDFSYPVSSSEVKDDQPTRAPSAVEEAPSSPADENGSPQRRAGRLTPRQRRLVAQERYRTYTIAEPAPPAPLSPPPAEPAPAAVVSAAPAPRRANAKQRRAEDRARYQTQTVDVAALPPAPSDMCRRNNLRNLALSAQYSPPPGPSPPPAASPGLAPADLILPFADVPRPKPKIVCPTAHKPSATSTTPSEAAPVVRGRKKVYVSPYRRAPPATAPAPAPAPPRRQRTFTKEDSSVPAARLPAAPRPAARPAPRASHIPALAAKRPAPRPASASTLTRPAPASAKRPAPAAVPGPRPAPPRAVAPRAVPAPRPAAAARKPPGARVFARKQLNGQAA